jgi:hypothetical protein
VGPDRAALLTRLLELALRMGADPADLPALGRVPGDAEPYLDVSTDDGTWHWLVAERGRVAEDRPLPGEEVLYAVAVHLAGRLAARREVAERRPAEDPRRQLFALHYDALARAGQGYADRWRAELAAEFVRIGQEADLGLLP